MVPSVKIESDTNWASIAGGLGHTIALKSDGTLWAWGGNGNSNVPVKIMSVCVPGGCTAESIAVNPVSLKLKKQTSGGVTVTVTGNGGCPVEGQKVMSKIHGDINIEISPKTAVTDGNGEATFTITALGKTGSATVTFTAGTLKAATVPVEVTK